MSWRGIALIVVILTGIVTAAPPTPNISAVSGSGPYFALTFDAHVEENGATEILNLLLERHVRATIFVTGRFAVAHPEILKIAARDGHEIGNHTFTHAHLTSWATNHRHDINPGVTRAVFQDELLRTAAAIQAAIGRPPSALWRAPYGEQNAEIRAWAREIGLLHIDWTRGDHDSLDALDWIDDPGKRSFMGPEAMARRLLNFEKRQGVPLAGSIILMHLGSTRSKPPLLEVLPMFLDETDIRGLHPVPVGLLLQRSGQASEPIVRAPRGGQR